MDKTIEFNEQKQALIVTFDLPLKQSGDYTYGDGRWTVDALCVHINKKFCEYTLNHAIYLDYKDSLQTGYPIFTFDSEEEGVQFAKDYNLMVTYDGYQDEDTVTPTDS